MFKEKNVKDKERSNIRRKEINLYKCYRKFKKELK